MLLNSKALLALAAVAAVSAPLATPAYADHHEGMETAVPNSVDLRKGLLIYSSDGRRIGKIYQVIGQDDVASAVKVIFNGKMIVIDADTLSAGDKPSRIQTSLAYDELR